MKDIILGMDGKEFLVMILVSLATFVVAYLFGAVCGLAGAWKEKRERKKANKAQCDALRHMDVMDIACAIENKELKIDAPIRALVSNISDDLENLMPDDDEDEVDKTELREIINYLDIIAG